MRASIILALFALAAAPAALPAADLAADVTALDTVVFSSAYARGHRVWQLAKAATDAQVRAALDEWARQTLAGGAPAPPADAARILLQVWARRAPAAAQTWVLAQDRRLPVVTFLLPWLSVRAQSDPAAAILQSAALDATGREVFRELLPPATATLAPWSNTYWSDQSTWLNFVRQDAGAAVALLARLPGRLWSAQQVVFAEYARLDPAAAAQAAAGLPRGRLRAMTFSAIIRQWMRADPAAAQAWAAALPDELERTQATAQAFALLAASDPAAAVTNWAKLPPGVTRDAALAPLLAAWAGRDPAGALAWMGEHFPSLEGRLLASQLTELVPVADAAAGRALLPLLPAGTSFQSAAVRRSLDDLPRRDLPAALAWARRLPGAEQRAGWSRAAMESILPYWGESDPVAALDYAQEYELNDGHNTRRNNVLTAWLRRDPPAALAWLEAQPPGPARYRLLRAALDAYATMDYPATRAYRDAWLASPNASAQEKSGLGAAVPEQYLPASTSSTANYVAAWARFASTPDSAVASFQNYETERIFRLELFAANQWLSTLPPGEVRDRNVVAFARVYAHFNPSGALAWLLTVNDEDARADALRRFFEWWAAHDPDAARAELARMPLPPPQARNLPRRFDEAAENIRQNGGRPPIPSLSSGF